MKPVIKYTKSEAKIKFQSHFMLSNFIKFIVNKQL